MTTNKPLRIVHLEDLESDARLVERELRKSKLNFEFRHIENKTDFKKALYEFSPDIVLSDHSLPSFTSSEALEMVKETGKLIPFIIITGTMSEEFAVSMMKEGVYDYILKDRLQRLPVSVMNAIEKLNAQKEKEEHHGKIAAQEKKFRALIEYSHEGIALFDRNFDLIYSSPYTTQITGDKNSTLSAKNLLQHCHPDDVASVEHTFKRLVQERNVPLNLIFRFRHHNGHYMWIDATFTNFLHDENVNAYVTNFRDITTKKESEEQLLRSSRHFKALIENISDAIVLVDWQARILYDSPSVKRITGFDFTETKGKDIFNFIHPSEVKRARVFVRQLMDTPGVPQPNTFRILHKNGHYIWAEGTVTTMLHDQTVKAFVINYRDVTPRKAGEELLRKSEASQRAIFENTPVSYVLIDKEFNIISFNQMAKKNYADEMNVMIEEGKNLVEIMPENRRITTRRVFESVLQGEKINYETSFRHGQQQHWFNVNMFPVHDARNPAFGLVISSENITERKQIEIERSKMTADILRHNKDLEQFAYIISHNLRSPVANIIGLSNIIQNHTSMSQEDFNRCIDGLSLSVKKLDNIILDLNFILQGRRGTNESKETVSLTAILNDIRTSISALIEKENIKIATNFRVNKLFTIRSYIYSIFYNLLINSIKYRRQDVQTSIQIQSKKVGNTTVITFKDNGLGIDMKTNQDKLFGLYKRFHPHIEGKGMGLYMVKTQVELLGGYIRIASEVNQGTEFTITLED